MFFPGALRRLPEGKNGYNERQAHPSRQTELAKYMLTQQCIKVFAYPD